MKPCMYICEYYQKASVESRCHWRPYIVVGDLVLWPACTLHRTSGDLHLVHTFQIWVNSMWFHTNIQYQKQLMMKRAHMFCMNKCQFCIVNDIRFGRCTIFCMKLKMIMSNTHAMNIIPNDEFWSQLLRVIDNLHDDFHQRHDIALYYVWSQHQVPPPPPTFPSKVPQIISQWSRKLSLDLIL